MTEDRATISVDSLGDRMKRYETVFKTRLTPRTPALIRLDGKAFHTFTQAMDRPYDARFHRCMWRAAQTLCEEVEGCKLAYVQSDEITLLLNDYGTLQTQPWFDYEVQKLCSVSASTCTVSFYAAFLAEFSLERLPGRFPAFDARCWNVPKEEVANAFIWRQQDATRNSISMLAQAHFSHKELHGVSSAGMQDKLMLEKGINWNDCPIPQRRGVCVVRETYELPVEGQAPAVRHRWVTDEAIPIFTKDREYVERWV